LVWTASRAVIGISKMPLSARPRARISILASLGAKPM
jgi:hypothetical protein